MSNYKSLIVSHRIVMAGRRRKCYHDGKHQLHKGDSCLEVREAMHWKGYCFRCAREMLIRAQRSLSGLQDKLDESS